MCVKAGLLCACWTIAPSWETHKYQSMLPWTPHPRNRLCAAMFTRSFSVLFSIVAATTGAVAQTTSSSIQTLNSSTSLAATVTSSQAVNSTASQADASATLQATAEVRSTQSAARYSAADSAPTDWLRYKRSLTLLPRVQLRGHRPLLHHGLQRDGDSDHEQHIYVPG